MADINRILQLNLELEGLLRILNERDSIHAKSILSEKYAEYSALLNELLAHPGDRQLLDKTESEAEKLAADATYVEVKDQEAESSEIEDETDAATAAIERGEARDLTVEETEMPGETFAKPAPAAAQTPRTPLNLTRAFTLNDKFRFTREVFGGDDRAFDDTLAVLSDMDSYDEACDFVYNDMMLDSSDADVAAFMAVIADNMQRNGR